MDSEEIQVGAPPAARELTPRQRACMHLLAVLADDLDSGTGTLDEQHTAALLRLCADAVLMGHTGELVLAMLTYEWARMEGER